MFILLGLYCLNGLQDPEKYRISYDLPESHVQLHLHGPDEDHLTHGHLLDYGRKRMSDRDLNGFEASMASSIAESLGFKKTRR